MKKNIGTNKLLFLCICMMSYLPLKATTPIAELWGARFAATFEYEPIKDLQISLSEELRLADYDILDCLYSEIGIAYKPLSFMQVGLSYTAITNFKGDTDLPLHNTNYTTDLRHRGTFDLTFSMKANQWKFSLRERIQATYRTTSVNLLEQPQTTWVLRSRLKAAYKPRRHPIEPYIYFEPRLLMNGALWNTKNSFETASFVGHQDAYFNRYRFSLGTEWQVTDHNALDFYLIYDLLQDKDITASNNPNPQLTMPITMQTNHYLAVCIAYTFSL
ncbi:MAG: DUF2490 domain-containing protein [Paludibacteraceae bacterium]|nr:DUF2490 domain-containing protein [Paludibacteraceae bacterium]